MEKNKTLTEEEIDQILEQMDNDWICGTPDLMNKWEVEGRPEVNLSPTDWMIENHPEIWKKVVAEYWESIPLDFGNIDPSEEYFIKKCFEEIDRKRAQV